MPATCESRGLCPDGRATRYVKQGSEWSFEIRLDLPRPADLLRSRWTSELGFDGFAEAVRAEGVLSLGMLADSVQFVRADGFHHEGAVACPTFVRVASERQIRGVMGYQWVEGA